MKNTDCPAGVGWSQPDLCDEDYRFLKTCFDTNWISQGPQVRAFEDRVAALAQRAHCVAVNSGTSALTAAMLSLGVAEACEVVIPAMAFIALPHVVTMLGATPVLADVERTTGIITAEAVESCITPRTKAVIAIDYGGFANDWDALQTCCRARGVPLVVDAASSFLSTVAGRPAGCFGDLAVFSFHSAKTITTGEGGAVVTDDAECASRLRQIRNYGEVPGRKYCYDLIGSNFRLTDLAACLGLSQLNRRHQILERRRRVIEGYLQNGAIAAHAHGFHGDLGRRTNGFTFTVVLPQFRDAVQQMLQANGVETRAMWPLCVDEQPAYQRRAVKTPSCVENARQFSRSCLSLPVHAGLTEANVGHVIRAFERAIP